MPRHHRRLEPRHNGDPLSPERPSSLCDDVGSGCRPKRHARAGREAGVDRSGRDAQHIDALRLEFAVQPLGKSLDIGLGGGVVVLPGNTLPAEEGTEYDDSTAAPFDHPPGEGLTEVRRGG